MKETILLFNLADKQTRRKVELALFPLKLRLRYIPKDQYNQPLGSLAGLGDVPPCEACYEGEELPDTMLVFAGLSDARLNQVLLALRRSKSGTFPYKAILTPTNQFWTAPECFAEIAREHELMHTETPMDQPTDPSVNLPKN